MPYSPNHIRLQNLIWYFVCFHVKNLPFTVRVVREHAQFSLGVAAARRCAVSFRSSSWSVLFPPQQRPPPPPPPLFIFTPALHTPSIDIHLFPSAPLGLCCRTKTAAFRLKNTNLPFGKWNCWKGLYQIFVLLVFTLSIYGLHSAVVYTVA